MKIIKVFKIENISKVYTSILQPNKERPKMSVAKINTTVHNSFFYAWTDEVKHEAEKLSGYSDPMYIVFVGSQDCTYLYFPTIILDNKHYNDISRDESKEHMLPVYCNPDVDMSTTSFGDYTGIHWVDYAEFSIEDITMEDVIKNICEAPTSIIQLSAVSDSDIKTMCMFVDLALPGSDTTNLISFIKQTLVDRGYDESTYAGYEHISPHKYTQIELKSEMMKCNKDMYDVYRRGHVDMMLTSITSEDMSKPEMEHGLSGLAYEILCDSVVSCTGMLWCFIEGVWKECSSDGYIWNFLTTEFINYLMSRGATKIYKFMMSITTRSQILKDIKMRLQDDNFYTLLDSKLNIVRMHNGVYNIDTMALSRPVPSDYVSVTTGVPFQIFDYDSSKMVQLMSILGSIFPDDKLLDFFVTSCSTFLEGYNSQKVFYIWWGFGNNAKTLVQTLVMKAFGEYCSTAPTSLVTGKRTESSNATPELCHVERKLVVFLQEPNPEEKIKAGRIKELTGNDSMYVRQLFKQGRTMTLKAKLVIVCNNILEIPGIDSAFKRRMVVIPFISTFLNEEEYRTRKSKGTLEPNSNIINPTIENALLSCKSAFMYLLCRKYQELKNQYNMSLHLPEIIKNVTHDYITRNNYPLKFINQFVHRVSGSSVAITEIYESFKEWFRKSYPNKKIHDFEIFTTELSEEGYKDNGSGFIDGIFVSYSGE